MTIECLPKLIGRSTEGYDNYSIVCPTLPSSHPDLATLPADSPSSLSTVTCSFVLKHHIVTDYTLIYICQCSAHKRVNFLNSFLEIPAEMQRNI